MGSLGKYILLKDTRNAVLRASVGNSLQLWLDASDSSTITESGGKVSQWNDKSGKGNDATQGTGSAQPTTGVTTHNGKNVIDWDGGDGLELPSGLFSIPNGNHTIFMVSKRSTETASLEVLLESLEVTSGKAVLGYSGTSGVLVFRNGPGPTVSKSGATNTDFQIIRGRRDGTTQAITFNNGTEATNTSAASESSIDSMTIGKAGTGANLIGSIAEILIYNRSLSTTEIRDIERYLATKWNIGISAPDNIGGLQLWLDANDSSTITESGGKVSQWDDKSGNGNDATQGTEANQPILQNDTLIGKSIIRFDGINDFLSSAFDASLDLRNNFTMIHVAKTNDITGARRIAGTNGYAYGVTSSGGGLFTLFGVKDYTSDDDLWATSSFIISTNTIDSSNDVKFFKNGSLFSTEDGATPASATNTGIFIGARNLLTQFWDGDIAEVLIYNRVLSTAELSAVHQYLSNKYGITLA